MNKAAIVGTVLGAIGVTTTGAVAGYHYMNQPTEPQFAEVLSVEPVTETFVTPRQQCEDKPVTRRAPTEDPNKVAGTVIGAVVGGLIGNQVGDGSGKKLATLAGAAAGGYAGNRVQGDLQAKDTVTTTERNCVAVNHTEERVIGYEVSYQLGDHQGVVQMAQQPGERIPVHNGELQLDGPVAGQAVN